MSRQLDDESVDAIACRVVELLTSSRGESETPLIDAAEVARRHGVSRAYVYDHAEDLGAIRLGNGGRPRLRFDPHRVAAILENSPEPAPPSKPSRYSRRKTRHNVPLLPIKGPM